MTSLAASLPLPSGGSNALAAAVRAAVITYAATHGTAYLDGAAFDLIRRAVTEGGPADVHVAATAAVRACDEARDALVLGMLPALHRSVIDPATASDAHAPDGP